MSVNTEPMLAQLRAFSRDAKRAGASIVADAAKRLGRIVLKETPPLGRFKKRKNHTDWLKKRILGMRLPRGKLTRSMMRDGHMTVKQSAAYFREAQRRQGEMLSGWNALAAFAGLRPAQWIARHGKKHGRVRVSGAGAGTTARVVFEDGAASRRFDMSRFVRDAAARVERGLAANARHAARALARRR